jgi:hypothetical protein
MAESKSAKYVSKIKEPSEFSSSVHPLTALAKFPCSECRPNQAAGTSVAIVEQARAFAFQRYLRADLCARRAEKRLATSDTLHRRATGKVEFPAIGALQSMETSRGSSFAEEA